MILKSEYEKEVLKYTEKRPKKIQLTQKRDTLRILAFSDWRIQKINDVFLFVQKIEPVDLIIYAGDDICRFQGRKVFRYQSI